MTLHIRPVVLESDLLLKSSSFKGERYLNKEELKKEQKVLDKTIERLKNQTYLVSHKGNDKEQLLRNAVKEPYFGQY